MLSVTNLTSPTTSALSTAPIPAALLTVIVEFSMYTWPFGFWTLPLCAPQPLSERVMLLFTNFIRACLFNAYSPDTAGRAGIAFKGTVIDFNAAIGVNGVPDVTVVIFDCEVDCAVFSHKVAVQNKSVCVIAGQYSAVYRDVFKRALTHVIAPGYCK